MNLSEILPALRLVKTSFEQQVALAKALGGITASVLAEQSGGIIASIADALQRVIDGTIEASAEDEAELRALYDAVLGIGADFDQWQLTA